MMNDILQQYIKPIICLLAMPLRYQWDDNLAINTLVLDLKDQLASGEEEIRVVEQIHAVLMKAWITFWSKSYIGYNIADPTEACMALLTLNQDGSFDEPKNITRIIVKFEYCMCFTFLREIRAQSLS